MLPQVQNLDFIRIANEFLDDGCNDDEDMFLDYVKEIISNFNIKKDKKDALKGLRYVKMQKSMNIDKYEWVAQSTYVYTKISNIDNSSLNDDKSRKRKLSDNESDENEKKRRRQNTKSNNFDREFKWIPHDILLSKTIPLLQFPQSIMDKAGSIINAYKYEKRIVVSGPTKCGKTTFIKVLAKKYGFQYFGVPRHQIENLDSLLFYSLIKKLTNDHDKIILHFNFNIYPTKLLNNFKFDKYDEHFDAQVLFLFESTFANQLECWSDNMIEFPAVGKTERQNYLEQFLSGHEIEPGFSYEKMAESTPGYQIGDIVKLCNILCPIQTTVTEDQFNDIIRSGEVKSIFFDRSKVNWDDIGGHDEVKGELKKVMNELLNEKSHRKPEGIILYGPPGCGKTMLAKALGESEKNVRDAFINARNSQPCILFIDEIDALCSERCESASGSRNSIVNTFLMEIDGICDKNDSQLLVIGATNYMKQIDSAISRSGRLGRHIEITVPKTSEERVAVLMAASKNGTTPKIGPSLGDDSKNVSAIDIFRKICRDEYTEGWNHSDLASLIFESIVQMKNDKEFDVNNQVVTETHLFHALKNKRLQRKKKKINKKFDENVIVTFVEDMDFSFDFSANDELMRRIKGVIKTEKVIKISGPKRSGKTTLIRKFAQDNQYNLVEMEGDYFKNFSIRRFCEDIFAFARINGSTMFRFDERLASKNVVRDIICHGLENAPCPVLVVVESLDTGLRYLNVKQKDLSKYISEILSQFQLEKTNLEKILTFTPDRPQLDIDLNLDRIRTEISRTWNLLHCEKLKCFIKNCPTEIDDRTLSDMVYYISKTYE